MNILVTGSAGFIGYHLARRLLEDGHVVHGVDNLTPYYDVRLKQARQALLAADARFTAHLVDVADRAALRSVFDAARPQIVVHLAAQAGVRHAILDPDSYIQANLVGTHQLIELSRGHDVRHLLMASTSSVYGASSAMPFTEHDCADTPLTIYAATKRAGELLGHSAAHLWHMPTTAFRFFTVYGPWGRPDMALFRFTRAILEGSPIDVHNHGAMARDFTYVDDLVEAIVRLISCVPVAGAPVGPDDSLSPVAPFRVVNIGGGQPVALGDFIAAIEGAIGRRAIRRDLPMQPGEVVKTWADPTLLERLTGYRPATPIALGVPAFVRWYRDYYKI
jgi:UDP-glucuronate 4-epimerase